MIDFAKVTSSLFIGTCPASAVDIKQLRLMGVTGVVNLQTDADFDKWKINFSELQQASYDLDLVIHRVPIIDFDDADLTEHLLTAVNALHRMIAVGHTIYLHCTAGRERSPSVAAAYLIKHNAMTSDQAELHLKSLRGCEPKMAIIKSVLDSISSD